MRRALAILLLAAVVSADEAEGYTRDFVRHLRANWSRVPNAQFLMDDDAYEVFSKSPKHAAEIASLAAAEVLKQGIDEKNWNMLGAFLMRVGERCLALAPKSADAHRAAAAAHLTRARLAVRLQEKPLAKDWQAAVDLLVRLDALRPDKGKTLSEAVRILMREHYDAKKLEAVCEIGRGAYPKLGLFRVPRMRARLDAASEDEALKKLLDDWKPLAETYDDDLLALYNEAVTVAKRRKVKTKHDWLLHTKRMFTPGVMFETPWYRWAGTDGWTQYERDGTPRTTITFEREHGELTTKHVKTAAARLQREINGKVTLKPGKRKLNRHIKRCFTFAMGGHDRQGDFVHCRVVFVRAVGRALGNITRVQIRSRSDKPDPEIELFLATLRLYSLKPGK